ncbi:MAG: gas vesicle protein [Nannocystaceae bacterium]
MANSVDDLGREVLDIDDRIHGDVELSDDERHQLTLCELLDRVLHKGVLVRGELVISVADIDLLYLGLQVILCSTDTAIDAGLVARRRRWVLDPQMIRNP